MSGFVYVVQNSSGLFKIGFTNDPRRRLTMLRTSTPDTLTLLGVVPGTMADEKALHSLLEPWRVAREWFRHCPALRPLLAGLRQLQPGSRLILSNGNPLRGYRIEYGLRMQEVADSIGASKSEVSRWERNIRGIPVNRCAQIERVTGIPREVLRPDIFGPVTQ